ncbi:chromosome segregation ATPase [Enterovibrio paralichthyis]|uniref:chromosome segregation ATPase n=1 Tax=Enterovibrio paralichthyis TaxID=2853805 RepID=UPI001C43CAFC|nr:chromosome segregation ATPase [Enterovibrio paralichthyis]MBV7299549.1 chromosome segregation ATPase [Enterovibrio paralichthyis]
MVSIHGLPQPIQRTGNTGRKKVRKAESSQESSQPSPVAKAVSRGIRNPELAQDAHQHIHYDLPDGRSRHALAAYMDVKNQAKREELMALFGVDIFV